MARKGITFFDEGKEIAKELSANFQGGVLLSNYQSPLINEQNTEDLTASINELTISNTQIDLNQRLDFLTLPIKNRFVISDFQSLNTSMIQYLVNDSLNSYHLIYNAPEYLGNVFIDTVFFQLNHSTVTSMLLNVRVANQGYNGILNLKVINNKDQQVYAKSFSLEEDDSYVDLSFELSTQAGGFYEIELDGDEIRFDNIFYFNQSIGRKSRVAILSASSNDFLSSVFANAQLFDLHEYSNQLEYNVLNGFDLIVLDGYDKLPEGLVSLKNPYFLIVPPPSVDLSSYSDFLGFDLITDEDAIKQEIDLDNHNPFFASVFASEADLSSNPVGTSLFQLAGDHSAIIQYRNRAPFLVNRDKMYFINSSLSLEHSNLVNHAVFLPIMYKLAFDASTYITSPYVYPGGYVEVDAERHEYPFKLSNEEFEYYPTYSFSNGKTLIEIPLESMPGHYTILQEEDTISHISINVPKRESVYMLRSMKELEEMTSQHDHISVISGGENREEINASTIVSGEAKTWKYLLLLALLFLLIEGILHRYLK